MSSVYLPHKQQGAALILALIVVVIVTMLATATSSDFLVTFRRVENQLLSQQALAYLRGAEGIVRQVLQEDDPSVDHLSEGWLDITQEFPLEQGVLSGTICDLQARFNLNTLGGTAKAPAQYTADQQMFIRLLQVIELPDGTFLSEYQAKEITDAVADWLDADNNVRGIGGAEDGYYGYLDIPYRTANRAMTSLEELRWVKGVDDVIFQALEPHVTVLPEAALLNINTASSTVIRSINELNDFMPLNPGDADAIVNARDGDVASGNLASIKQGFKATTDFVAEHPAANGNNLNMGRLAVKSDYFLLDSSTIFIDREYRSFSILHRDSSNGRVEVIARARNGLGQCYGLGT